MVMTWPIMTNNDENELGRRCCMGLMQPVVDVYVEVAVVATVEVSLNRNDI